MVDVLPAPQGAFATDRPGDVAEVLVPAGLDDLEADADLAQETLDLGQLLDRADVEPLAVMPNTEETAGLDGAVV